MTEKYFFDTDCLSAFLWVREESILAKLYAGRIILPAQVYNELKKVPHLLARADTLKNNGDLLVESMEVGSVEYKDYLQMTTAPEPGMRIIGDGEAAGIAMVKQRGGTLASNNMRDIPPYVKKYSIDHVTTGDISLDMTGLRVLKVNPDLEWAMLVAYNRGKMDEARGTSLYERYSAMSKGYDVIVGSIANDRMFYVLDNFFLGNITDKALVMSLSALQLGEQYVAITEKACAHVKIEAEVELSHLERIFLRDLSESNRVKGVNLANEICRDYRREGQFFDEILREAER